MQRAPAPRLDRGAALQRQGASSTCTGAKWATVVRVRAVFPGARASVHPFFSVFLRGRKCACAGVLLISQPSLAVEPAGGATVYMNNLFEFNLAGKAWTELSGAIKVRPPARRDHGFASAGGKIYVHAGAGLGGPTAISCLCEGVLV
jgi:hypothetical protein